MFLSQHASAAENAAYGGGAWQTAPTRIKHQVVAFDAADLTAESRFWAGVVGGKVEEDEDWHMVRVDRCTSICESTNLAEPHEHVMALGATLLKPAAGNTFQVYADPAGHPFCLCWMVGQEPEAT